MFDVAASKVSSCALATQQGACERSERGVVELAVRSRANLRHGERGHCLRPGSFHHER
jgi:hypothetical protein